ncbi:MAG: S1C family serine protease [Acholeplasmataceae bacterium]|nr:S1C family serine protease [Acholeplasmataceae bacterium]
MKKIYSFLIVLMILIGLSGCTTIRTYEDLLLDYQTHLEENKEVYQSYIDYFNHISTETIQSVVLVKKIVTGSTGSTTGSGVIYKEDANYYYVLTNNHVVYYAGSSSISYTVSDYYGNDYTATRIVTASSYDLAIVRFRKTTVVLEVIEFAEKNAPVNSQVAVLGDPSYQINAIPLGVDRDYTTIDIESSNPDVINVNFPVLVSDAPVKSGSSGSLVINEDYQLTGIVYAGNFTNSSDTSQYSFAIPLDKVLEFLELVGMTVGGDES